MHALWSRAGRDRRQPGAGIHESRALQMTTRVVLKNRAETRLPAGGTPISPNIHRSGSSSDAGGGIGEGLVGRGSRKRGRRTSAEKRQGPIASLAIRQNVFEIREQEYFPMTSPRTS